MLISWYVIISWSSSWTKGIEAALWMLMAWCISTRTSAATLLPNTVLTKTTSPRLVCWRVKPQALFVITHKLSNQISTRITFALSQHWNNKVFKNLFSITIFNRFAWQQVYVNKTVICLDISQCVHTVPTHWIKKMDAYDWLVQWDCFYNMISILHITGHFQHNWGF